MGSNLIYFLVTLVLCQHLATCAPNSRPHKREDKKPIDSPVVALNSIDKSAVKDDKVKAEEGKDKSKVAAGSSQNDQSDKEFIALIDGELEGGAPKEDVVVPDQTKKEESKKGENGVGSTPCKYVRCSPEPVGDTCKVIEAVPYHLVGLTGGCCPIHDCRRADGSSYLHYAFEIEEIDATTVKPVNSISASASNNGDLFNPFSNLPSPFNSGPAPRRIQRPIQSPPQQGYSFFAGPPLQPPPPFFFNLGLARPQSSGISRGPPPATFFARPGSPSFAFPPFQNKFFPQLSPPLGPQFIVGDETDPNIRFSRNAAPNPGPLSPFSGSNNAASNPEGGFRAKRNQQYEPSNIFNEVLNGFVNTNCITEDAVLKYNLTFLSFQVKSQHKKFINGSVAV
ncbi:hypothetical protein Ocin01_08123 [Orchesella cincta]|uniref:Uncharacterized protein n=1 Tax=Orchesella cincta TaxID=48709 RepID=A0A1D2N0G1_ORCCI|nr:hypothetical protein Ocin01_08123 [Orchesella cincta]